MNDYYTVGEASKMLGISSKTLRKWDTEGTLPAAHKVGQHRRYSKNQIETYLGSKVGTQTDPILAMSKEELEAFVEGCNKDRIRVVDFNTTLGDTLRDKYHGLYVAIVSHGTTMHRETEYAAPNLIITSPEISTVFETSTAGFAPASYDNNFFVSGKRPTVYAGTVNARWRLYRTIHVPAHQLILGYVEDNKLFDDPKFRSIVSWANYVI